MRVEFEEDESYTGLKNPNMPKKEDPEKKGLLSIFTALGLGFFQAKVVAVILTIIFFGLSVYFFSQ